MLSREARLATWPSMETLVRLLDRLKANPASEYLVIEESGEIYGVLSTADVERAFVAAMARPH